MFECVELWQPIPFAPRHLASSFGRIMGLRAKPLVLIPNHRDYLVVNLHKIQYRVNRVICWTFHGEPPTPDHEAAHKDNNKQNNRWDNLYWATSQQNADDLSATGVNKGLNAPRSLLTEAEVRYIRAEYDKGYSVASIAAEFPQVSYVTVRKAALRLTYQEIE